MKSEICIDIFEIIFKTVLLLSQFGLFRTKQNEQKVHKSSLTAKVSAIILHFLISNGTLSRTLKQIKSAYFFGLFFGLGMTCIFFMSDGSQNILALCDKLF